MRHAGLWVPQCRKPLLLQQSPRCGGEVPAPWSLGPEPSPAWGPLCPGLTLTFALEQACQDRSPGVHRVGRGLRGSTRPQHIGAPPSPAAPSLIKEGRKEGRVTGSISGLWKAWQGSSRKPGNLEGNSHSPPLPILGTPPPSPRDAAPPIPPGAPYRIRPAPWGPGTSSGHTGQWGQVT